MFELILWDSHEIYLWIPIPPTPPRSTPTSRSTQLSSYPLPIGPHPRVGLHAHLHPPPHLHIGILSVLNLFRPCVCYYNCCKFVCATALLSGTTTFNVSRTVPWANSNASVQTGALSCAGHSDEVESRQSYRHVRRYWHESDTGRAQDPCSTRSPEDLSWPGK